MTEAAQNKNIENGELPEEKQGAAKQATSSPESGSVVTAEKTAAQR
jgi:hypothetical protein